MENVGTGSYGQALLQEAPMSLHPAPAAPVPDESARVARAAFPQGNAWIQLRDAVGPLYDDASFAPLFATRGRPSETPGSRSDPRSSRTRDAPGGMLRVVRAWAPRRHPLARPRGRLLSVAPPARAAAHTPPAARGQWPLRPARTGAGSSGPSAAPRGAARRMARWGAGVKAGWGARRA